MSTRVHDVEITVRLRGRLYGEYDPGAEEFPLTSAIAVRYEAPFQDNGYALMVNEVHVKLEGPGAALGWTIARLERAKESGVAEATPPESAPVSAKPTDVAE